MYQVWCLTLGMIIAVVSDATIAPALNFLLNATSDHQV